MAKIKKYSLEQLSKVNQILNKEEEMFLIGGGTAYIMDNYGNIQATNPCDGNDRISIVNGSTYGSTFVPDYGSSSGSEIDSGKTFMLSSSITTSHYGQNGAGLTIEGQGSNTALFQFLANNTSVEWGLNSNGKGGDNCCINSSHETSELDGLFLKGYDSYYHSHPANTDYLSEDDYETYQGVENKRDKDTNEKTYNYKVMGIYTPRYSFDDDPQVVPQDR